MSDPHAELPATTGVAHPPTGLLTRARPAARWLVRRRFAVEVHAAGHVPGTGPVILACNHTGFMDGPLLAIFAPRPVHAWTKSEMFTGRLGPFLAAAGQIRLDRLHPDPGAVKGALRVLRDGGVLGVYPEGTRGLGDFATFRGGAAYLALATGAPVVPCVMFGVRRPGQHSGAIPGRGDRVDVVFGAPWRTEPVPFPRRRDEVLAASEALRRHLVDHLDHARDLTGRDLPGPLPVDDLENAPGQEAAEGASP